MLKVVSFCEVTKSEIIRYILLFKLICPAQSHVFLNIMSDIRVCHHDVIIDINYFYIRYIPEFIRKLRLR